MSAGCSRAGEFARSWISEAPLADSRFFCKNHALWHPASFPRLTSRRPKSIPSPASRYYVHQFRSHDFPSTRAVVGARARGLRPDNCWGVSHWAENLRHCSSKACVHATLRHSVQPAGGSDVHNRREHQAVLVNCTDVQRPEESRWEDTAC
jgi:hypothetical protein